MLKFAHLLLLTVLCAGLPLLAQHPGNIIFPNETDSLSLQWGQETVEAFLAVHGLESSEVSTIHTYARQDLRDNVRSFAWTHVQALIRHAAAGNPLEPHEQRVLDKIRESARALRVAPVQVAVEEKRRFRSNMCGWKPDADIAKSANFSYDGTYYCPTPPWTPLSVEFPPQLPPKEYFLAYGQKKAWIEPLAARPGGLRSLVHISLGGQLLLGIGISAGLAVALASATLLVKVGSIYKLIAPFAGKAGTNGFIRATGAWSSWAGVAITAAITIITLVVVIYLHTENDRVLRELDTLETDLAHVSSQPTPDVATLNAMLSNDKAYQLLYISFLNAIVPASPLPAPAALPTPSLALDPAFVVQVPGASTKTAEESITFAGWDGEKYRARLWRGWILAQGIVPAPNVEATSINLRFRYRWSGKKYELSRHGDIFAIRKAEQASGDVECPPDPVTGVSSAADFTKCRSFSSKVAEIDLDGVGRRLISVSRAVVFTSGMQARVSWGIPAQIPITATGEPSPTISVTNTLPAGFTLQGGTGGSATLVWDGRTNAPALGDYSISLRAQNASLSATSTLQLSVVNSVRFTSPTTEASKTYTLPVGEMVNLTIAATGPGSPRPSLVFALPGTCGLSTSAGPDNTLLLTGRLAFPDNVSRQCTLGFEAGPLGNKDTLALTFVLVQPPVQPSLLTSSFTAYLNQQNEFLLRTGGANGPVSISLTTNSAGQRLAPSWVILVDRGDGTARLAANPPADAPDRVLVPLWYRITGTAGNQATSATDGVWLNIHKKPVFDVGTNLWTFLNNYQQQYAGYVRNASGTLTLSQPLPDGLVFTQHDNGLFTISGKATGAADIVTEVLATNAHGTSSFPIRVITLVPVKITSPDVVNFYIGRNNTFAITTTGYPMRPVDNPSENTPEPISISSADAAPGSGNFANGLRLTTTDPVTGEPLYGKALIIGNPARGSNYTVNIKADGGGGGQNQRLLMRVLPQGDVSGDGYVNCSDVSFISTRYGQRPGMANYDYNADYNQDGVIDIRDTAMVAARLPAGTKCN